jgi:transposase
LPLYRQQAIYARDQVELDRSLMAQWMGKVGFELQPLADYVLERIKQGERVFAVVVQFERPYHFAPPVI